MEEKERTAERGHRLVLHNRKSGIISGVLDVLSFDLKEILLETEQGMLMLRGSDLHVKRLTLEKGEVDIEGMIDSLQYSAADGTRSRQNESLLGRLFK